MSRSGDLWSSIDARRYVDFSKGPVDTSDDDWFRTRHSSAAFPSPANSTIGMESSEEVDDFDQLSGDEDDHVHRNPFEPTLTRPREFRFATEARVRPQHNHATTDPHESPSRPQSRQEPLSLTQPKPFSFQTSSRARPSEHVSHAQDTHHENNRANQQRRSTRSRRKSRALPQRETRRLTRPSGFSFATEQRFGAKEQAPPSPVDVSMHDEPEERALTRPVGFSFATDMRFGSSQENGRAHAPVSGDDMIDSAPSPSMESRRFVPKLTHPISPSFATRARFGDREAVPAKPSTTKAVSHRPTKKPTIEPKLTVPKGPNFQTRHRTDGRTSMQPRVSHHQQKEKQDVAQMPYQFKARQWDRSVVDNVGASGIHMVKKTFPTTPSMFHFPTDDRMKAKRATTADQGATARRQRAAHRRRASSGRYFTKSTQIDQEEPHLGHSRGFGGIESNGLTSRTKRSTPSKRKLTVPTGPSFMTEARGSMRRRQREAQKGVSDGVNDLQPQRKHRRVARGSRRSRRASARPMRLTKPCSPRFATTTRQEAKRSALRSRRSAEETKERRRAEFTARPFQKAKPFQPKPSTKRPTRPRSIAVYTDKRSKRRSAYNQQMEDQLDATRQAKELREKIRRKKEQKEIKRLRKTMVPKARPNRMHSASMPRAVAPKPLTNPSTPKFASFKTRLGRGALERKALGDRTDTLRNTPTRMAFGY